MTYSEVLNYIHSAQKFGPRPGLHRIRALLGAMGNPQNTLRYVHITGTNGKGSTAMMTTRVLMDAGYRVGTFISPYVDDFRERMQVNGEMISEEALTAQMEALLPCIAAIREMGHLHPTEFEMVTALAMGYFAGQHCDIVVLEVGMGGRWDCTNVIEPPEAAVITPVALDHIHILGSTVAEIARDKSGIFKSGSEAVTCFDQHPDALAVMREVCAEVGIPLHIPDRSRLSVLSRSIDGTELSYDGLSMHLSLPGGYQIQNALTVVEICRVLMHRGWKLTEENIVRGIAATRFAGRMEVIRRQPLCILDGGHNPSGANALVQAVREYLPGRRIIAVMGMMADKDTKTCVTAVASLADVFIATHCGQPRALDAQALAELARPYAGTVLWENTVTKAAKRALEMAHPEDVVLVCGSLYILHDARLACEA